jgi:thioredoxin reductase (NADPH)
MRTVDLVVIGAGVAGLTAAATAARHGLKTVVVEGTGAGGQVINVDHVDNFPGLPQTAGYELGPLLQEQAETAGAEFMLATVEAIELDGNDRLVKTSDGTLRARAVIVAAGSSKRALGVPSEERLQGRGVSHCASCDGPLFRGLRACVVGGGDSALDEALALAAHAGRVTLIHRGTALEAQQCLVDRVKATSNITLMLGTVVEEIVGDQIVSAVRLHQPGTGERRSMETDGVFVYVGLAPNTGFLNGLLALDAQGRIDTDAMLRTSVPGIFAAGDIRSGSVALLASSAGDGATAAVAAQRYLASLAA